MKRHAYSPGGYAEAAENEMRTAVRNQEANNRPKAFLHVTQHTDEGPFGMTYPRGTAATRRRIFAAIRLWRNQGHGAVIERYTNPPALAEADHIEQLRRDYNE